MTTQQIIWTVVIVVAALALIAFIVASMRKRNRQANETRAGELRQEAQQSAAVIPDAQVRAKETAAEAERARLEAQHAEERAHAARTEVVQHEAVVEEQVREADRLDPEVNHRSKDYTPDTSSVIGSHAAERTEQESADPHPSGASTGTHAGERTETTGTSTTGDAETIFDSRDSDTTDTDTTGTRTTETTSTDPSTDTRTTETTSTDPSTDTRTTGTTSTDPSSDTRSTGEPDWTDPDQRDGGTGGSAGGSHRA